MRIYVEQWRPTPAWLELDSEQRGKFMAQVGPDLQGVLEQGAEILALGAADPTTAHHVGKDYFAVWSFPSLELAREFERGIEAAGWYDYFEQVNLGGQAIPFEALVERLVEA
ncbi:DUF6616 family protein [Blastococcus deserti]|uniref:DUF6616 family protein n=1 Tax=Blastococcus deserti TaxID=2259033 RepID=A0ABW4X989_9ACTN